MSSPLNHVSCSIHCVIHCPLLCLIIYCTMTPHCPLYFSSANQNPYSWNCLSISYSPFYWSFSADCIVHHQGENRVQSQKKVLILWKFDNKLIGFGCIQRTKLVNIRQYFLRCSVFKGLGIQMPARLSKSIYFQCWYYLIFKDFSAVFWD